MFLHSFSSSSSSSATSFFSPSPPSHAPPFPPASASVNLVGSKPDPESSDKNRAQPKRIGNDLCVVCFRSDGSRHQNQQQQQQQQQQSIPQLSLCLSLKKRLRPARQDDADRHAPQ